MRVLRLVTVLALAAPLGASQASALPSRPKVENYTRGAFSLLEDLLAVLWNKAGCRIDPLGGCAPSTETEAGCRIDPWGRCGS